MIVRGACDNVESRCVDRAHLVCRQADIALFEGLVVVFDRNDLIRADRMYGDARGAEAPHEVVLQLRIGDGIRPHDVDLRADNPALLHEGTPERIGHHAAVIACEDIRARERDRLAVDIELLECCLIDGERGDARLFCLRKDFLCRETLAGSEFEEPLIVDGELHCA